MESTLNIRRQEPVSYSIERSPGLRNFIYTGCSTLDEELAQDPALKYAWDEAAGAVDTDCSKEDIALYCYTSDKPPFYRQINESLIKWSKNDKSENYPYKSFVNLLTKQVEKMTNLELYHGEKRETFFELVSSLNVGDIMTTDKFESNSENDSVARQYLRAGDRFGVLYKVRTNFAIKVLDKSKFKDEKEYLIPPGAQFRVTKLEKADQTNKPYHYMEINDLDFKIMTIRKDLALNAQGREVTIEEYNGSDEQRWYLQMNYIHNKATGEVLDVDKSGSKGTRVILYRLLGRPNQEWIRRESYLKCGHENLVMDIDGDFKPGRKLMAWTPKGRNNQKFFFEKIMEDNVAVHGAIINN